MCGILFSTVSNMTEAQFKKALSSMAYRGPDAEGFFRHQHFSMGHRRLAIVDLNPRSNQPFFSENKQSAIIFNGEIYNFNQLARKHHLILKTKSDTEVLLQLYEKLGEKMLAELNGMFTFIIVDFSKNTFFIARDRLGVKPLFYAHHQDGMIFSSEPAAILKLIEKTTIDSVGLRQYRQLRNFYNGHTIWKEIKEFPAGHYLTENKLKSWWNLSFENQDPPSDDALASLIRDAVSIREIADVKMGSYLSGGLDSTIVASLTHHLDTWTAGFEDYNEFQYAEIAAHFLKTHHHEVIIPYKDYLSIASKMITIRQEPLCVPNEVLLYQTTQTAAKYNTVLLSGEGADELFYGYDRIFKWANRHHWDLRAFSELYAYGSLNDIEIIESAITPFLDKTNTLKTVSSFFQISHLKGLLRRLDSASMLCSVEVRTPFVDYRLVERLAGTPFEWRMQNNVIKAPLKRIFENKIPQEIINRPKVGFPVPLNNIFNTTQNNQSAMDAWFEFNLSTLFKEKITIQEVL